MALSTTTSSVTLSGNGSTTVFPYTFPIPDAASLQVYYTDTSGVQTLLSASQYSVTGLGGTTGGNVTYPLAGSPIASLTKLTISRLVDYTQTTVFTNQGAYYPAVTESRFDRVMMAIQQLAASVGRALVAPISDGSIGALPTAAQRANTFLGFDASGNPIAVLLQTTVLAVSNFIQTNILPASSAAAVRAAIGFGDVNYRPGGRLTLVTATPVMTSSQASKSTIFYTPYVDDLCPIYNGSAFVPTRFAELSNITTASSVGNAGPAAVTTNSNYDLFVWSNAGVLTLTRGPAWTSDTGRGTGAGTTELQRVLGIWTNKVAITNGPGIGLGTYVGTVRSDGSSQINWVPGSNAAGGGAALLGVWNAYNRVDVSGMVGDSTANWTYSGGAFRSANNSTGWRISWLSGLQEEPMVAKNNQRVGGGGTSIGAVAVGLNSTSVPSGQGAHGNLSSGAIANWETQAETTVLGWNFFQALETADGSTVTTWYGTAGFAYQVSGLHYLGRF